MGNKKHNKIVIRLLSKNNSTIYLYQMKYLLSPFLTLLFTSTIYSQTTVDKLFKPLAINYNNRTVLLSEGFRYKVLFSEGDMFTS